MSTNVLLLRHGQTDWNSIGRVMGPQPIPLNEKGRDQARLAGEWLKTVSLSAIYSSPIQRSMETAQLVAERQNGAMVVPEPRIAEIDYGDWVNRTFDEIKENYFKEWQSYRVNPSTMQIPGGELVSDVQTRAVAVVERVRVQHKDQTVLLVSHADVIKAILIHYLGVPLDCLQRVGIDNGGVSVLRFGTTFGDRMVAMNVGPDIPHLLRDVNA